eukprot:COSAG01_NODE_6320_length_3737_cov_2.088785_3_plen_181_part_00
MTTPRTHITCARAVFTLDSSARFVCGGGGGDAGLAVALDVAQALRYCHSHQPPVIHRDIKSANVLIDEVTGAAQLCDFGLSSSAVVTAGTPSYMAPELLAGRTFNASVDVYAWGILLWELFAEQMRACCRPWRRRSGCHLHARTRPRGARGGGGLASNNGSPPCSRGCACVRGAGGGGSV